MEIWYTCFLSPFGWCAIVKGRDGLLRILLPEPEEAIVRRAVLTLYPFAIHAPDANSPEAEALQNYFSGNKLNFPFALDESGATAFQKKVWKAVREIPCGQVRTYQWVARRIKNPDSMRAVGNALGRNPFPIVIPCHRVIRADGELGGFSSSMGIRLKASLLQLEGVKLRK